MQSAYVAGARIQRPAPTLEMLAFPQPLSLFRAQESGGEGGSRAFPKAGNRSHPIAPWMGPEYPQNRQNLIPRTLERHYRIVAEKLGLCLPSLKQHSSFRP
jgi:hypothetical protein